MSKVKLTHDEVMRARVGISLDTAVSNILATWERCTPAMIEAGATWYGDTERLVDTMSSVTGHSRVACAVTLAHLSPRTTWQRNVAAAWAVLTAVQTAGAQFDAGRVAGAMGGNLTRAVYALAQQAHGDEAVLATLHGPKTRAFALNILGDRDAVTVDVWAARVAIAPEWVRGEAGDVERMLSRAGVYAAISEAYRIAAARAGVDATTMQASCWVAIRNGRVG